MVQIVTEDMATESFNQMVASQGVGTGIILDEHGHILTNNHVIAGARRITVILQNGDSLPAEVVGGDSSTDVALLRIEARWLQPLQHMLFGLAVLAKSVKEGPYGPDVGVYGSGGPPLSTPLAWSG